MRYQLYRGNPKLMGKDWNKNERVWVKCPINDPILDVESLLNRTISSMNFQTNKWFTQQEDKPLVERWIADTDIIFKEDSFGLISMTFKDERRHVEEYYYHTPAEWRGRRDRIVFHVGNQHRIVNTNKEITPQPGNSWDYKNLTSPDRLFLLDNDYGIWVTEGDNGFMTFNHLHKFNRDTWHDDFHRGHWCYGMEFRGNNNSFIYNWHAQTKWKGILAGDTWGSFFRVVGEGNIIIFNIYDGVQVELLEKLGDNFFDVTNWEKNLVIVNMFDTGRLRPNYTQEDFIADSTRRWKERVHGIGALLNRSLGQVISDSIDRHHNHLRYPAAIKQDVYLPAAMPFSQVNSITIRSVYTFPDCDLDTERYPYNLTIIRRTDALAKTGIKEGSLVDELYDFIKEVRLETPIVLRRSNGWKYTLTHPIEYPAPTFFRERYYSEYVGVVGNDNEKVTINFFRMFKPEGVNISHEIRLWDPHVFLHTIIGLGEVEFSTTE